MAIHDLSKVCDTLLENQIKKYTVDLMYLTLYNNVLFDKGTAMEFMDFTYTKKAGETSDRTLLVLGKPNPNYFGVDVSDVLNEDFHDLSLEFNQLYNTYQENLRSLMEKYDLKHNFRAFNPEKMQNVEVYGFTQP